MKNILYPIFIQSSNETTDPFWNYIFNQLSYGICPFGVTIHNTDIYCNFPGKHFHYDFSNKSHTEIYNDITTLFKEKLDIQSKNDLLREKKILNESIHFSFDSWKDIKKKNIKDILIEQYVISLKHKYDLSYIRVRKILASIHLAFTFKIISNDDVRYDKDKGCITHIQGFHIDKNMFNDIPFIPVTKDTDIAPRVGLFNI